MNSLKTFIINASLITLLFLGIVIITGIALGVFSPFHPGDLFFPLQYSAEEELALINSNPEIRAAHVLDLLERRLDDLRISKGGAEELISLKYLDKALDLATSEVSLISAKTHNELRYRFYSLLTIMDKESAELSVAPVQEAFMFQELQIRIQGLLHTALTGRSSGYIANPIEKHRISNPTDITSSDMLSHEVGGLIPFPPGSAGAEHAFYPLTGRHAVVNCQSCHTGQVYSGTPKACIRCHLFERPEPHYYGQCGFCHTPVAWTDIIFDHSKMNTNNCVSCHAKDEPVGHYAGQCSACHMMQAWDIVSFNHAVAGAVDCVACHSKEAPANHYPGQCSNCHITENWITVSFDHRGFADCNNCHSGEAPASHFPGYCSACHSTSSWQGAVFNHSGFTDCTACHANNAPSGHFSGQCSGCHSTSTWQGAVFNHSGFTDCVGCHSGDAPSGHFEGQCSVCHSTSGWQGAAFNHTGFTDCIGCHVDDAPAGHYSGQCSDCHSTGGWGGATFNHDGFTDCISCHSGDRPREHDQGQCSECHNTQNWGDAEDQDG